MGSPATLPADPSFQPAKGCCEPGQLVSHPEGYRGVLLQGPRQMTHAHFLEQVVLACNIFPIPKSPNNRWQGQNLVQNEDIS